MDSETFRNAVNHILKETVHTIKPAIITKLNLELNTVSVKPLTTTLWQDNVVSQHPELDDVPLMVLSANAGAAAITMPVKVGDMCSVFFSDRSYGSLLDEQELKPVATQMRNPFGGEAIGAFVGIFTNINATTIDPDNVVIRNGETTITLTPDEDINIKSNGSVNVDTKVVNVTSETATVVATSGITVNSPTANFTGDIIAAGDVECTSVLASSEVTAGSVELTKHKHTTVAVGSPTSVPIP